MQLLAKSVKLEDGTYRYQTSSLSIPFARLRRFIRHLVNDWASRSEFGACIPAFVTLIDEPRSERSWSGSVAESVP